VETQLGYGWNPKMMLMWRVLAFKLDLSELFAFRCPIILGQDDASVRMKD